MFWGFFSSFGSGRSPKPPNKTKHPKKIVKNRARRFAAASFHSF
jgi:hypothetical protein